MKQLEVVAAILTYKGKILCMQRGKGNYPYVSFKYEFPGGKIEPGESRHEALERELREEMNIHIPLFQAPVLAGHDGHAGTIRRLRYLRTVSSSYRL